MTENELLSALEHTFPGISHPTVSWSGGVSTSTIIWDFYIETSLTKIARISKEINGTLHYTFRFKPAKGRKTTLRKGQTESVEEFLAFLVSIREYLYGIAAAIEMACDTPLGLPTGPDANIFS